MCMPAHSRADKQADTQAEGHTGGPTAQQTEKLTRRLTSSGRTESEDRCVGGPRCLTTLQSAEFYILCRGYTSHQDFSRASCICSENLDTTVCEPLPLWQAVQVMARGQTDCMEEIAVKYRTERLGSATIVRRLATEHKQLNLRSKTHSVSPTGLLWGCVLTDRFQAWMLNTDCRAQVQFSLTFQAAGWF